MEEMDCRVRKLEADSQQMMSDIKTLDELMAVVGVEGSAVIYSAERDRLPVIALADDWLDGC